MKTYEAASYITTFGFSCTLLTNSLLIYLTISHIRLITGPYKWMIVLFALIGILFSFLEVIVHPCVHNFNAGFMFFSLNLSLPKWLLSLGVACYGGFYSSLLAFVNVQFMFRCWTLIGSKWTKTFQGVKVLFWILFILFPCSFFMAVITLSIAPDDYSDAYMEEEILKVYEEGIKDIPRHVMVAYENGEVRWKNLSFVGAVAVFLTVDLVIIGYCALRMRREMKLRLKTMSKRNRKLETQFFKALLAQSAFPTFLLALPAGPVLFLPLLDLKVSLQSGFLFSLFSLYPPMDSIAMMMIITEYKGCMRRVMKSLLNPCGASDSEEGAMACSDSGTGIRKANSLQMASR